MMKIAIAAATGNIGSRVAKQISSAGVIPILLGQSLDRLNQLEINDSISRITDLSDPEQVIQATKDADALLWLVPPVMTVPSLREWYNKVTTAGIAAVGQNKIKRVILISSLGAGTADELGTVSYAGDMEIAFDQLNTNVLTLRPGYFMENILIQAESIKSGNEFSFTYKAGHDIPWISTDDIGDTVAKFLLDSTWAGRWKLNLMGPENLNCREAALRISGILGERSATGKNQCWKQAVNWKCLAQIIRLVKSYQIYLRPWVILLEFIQPHVRMKQLRQPRLISLFVLNLHLFFLNNKSRMALCDNVADLKVINKI